MAQVLDGHAQVRVDAIAQLIHPRLAEVPRGDRRGNREEIRVVQAHEALGLLEALPEFAAHRDRRGLQPRAVKRLPGGRALNEAPRLPQARRDGRERPVPVPARPLEIRVNVVGKDQHIPLKREGSDHVHLALSPHAPRRVVRAAPEQQVRSLHRAGEQILGNPRCLARQVEGHPAQLAPGALHDLDDRPVRRIQRHHARRAPQRPRQDDRAQGRHALDDAREKVHVARLERPPVAALLPAGRGLAEVIEDLRVAENPLRARVHDRARHLRARRELHVRDR